MPWVHRLHEVSVPSRGVTPWAIALAVFAGSFSLRILFDPVLAGMKFLTFYPAIAVATLICGWREGLLVLLLSMLAAWFFFLDPVNSFELKGLVISTSRGRNPGILEMRADG